MNTLINVCGTQRSGTTMLHLMLATGPNAVACGEIAGWYRVARYRKDAQLPTVLKAFENIGPYDFHKEAFDHFGVDFIVDSSKGIDRLIDTTRIASQKNFRCFNVLIWKHPIDLAYSKWKRNKFDEWHSQYLRYHQRLFRSGIEFLTVSYDELVESPSEKLSLLCDYIDMPYFEGKERFWREKHEFTASSEGVRKQVESGHSEFKKPIPPLILNLTQKKF